VSAVTEIHNTAAQGFDTAAKVYAAARPGYPRDGIDWMIEELGIDVGSPVLDLAAGTGKLTVELARRGLECIAVEPVEAMRAELMKVVPSATALDGTAESIPLADASVDAITVAQAFHWFDFDRALREMHRALRPSHRMALLWNLRDDSVDWVDQITQIIDPYAEGTGVGIPRHRDRAWQPVIDDNPAFTKRSEARFPHTQPMDAQGLVGRIASTSFIAVLDDTRRAAVLGQIEELARTHPALAGKETFDFPYICEISVFDRRD
jgi:SAM-dependent methyltransferase